MDEEQLVSIFQDLYDRARADSVQQERHMALEVAVASITEQTEALEIDGDVNKHNKGKVPHFASMGSTEDSKSAKLETSEEKHLVDVGSAEAQEPADSRDSKEQQERTKKEADEEDKRRKKEELQRVESAAAQRAKEEAERKDKEQAQRDSAWRAERLGPWHPEGFTIMGDFENCAYSNKAKSLMERLRNVTEISVLMPERQSHDNKDVVEFLSTYPEQEHYTSLPRIAVPAALAKYWLNDDEFREYQQGGMQHALFIGGFAEMCKFMMNLSFMKK